METLTAKKIGFACVNAIGFYLVPAAINWAFNLAPAPGWWMIATYAYFAGLMVGQFIGPK